MTSNFVFSPIIIYPLHKSFRFHFELQRLLVNFFFLPTPLLQHFYHYFSYLKIHHSFINKLCLHSLLIFNLLINFRIFNVTLYLFIILESIFLLQNSLLTVLHLRFLINFHLFIYSKYFGKWLHCHFIFLKIYIVNLPILIIDFIIIKINLQF